MKRRIFLQKLGGLLCTPIAAQISVFAGLPATRVLASGAASEWPQWQYGNYIIDTGECSVAELKTLCGFQIRDLFERLYEPDQSDKVKWYVRKLDPNGVDYLTQQGTVGWKVTILAPVWQLHLRDDPKYAWRELRRKSHARTILFAWGGKTQEIPRGIVREYARSTTSIASRG